MGKASTRAHNKWIAKAYDRINLTVPKGRKETIQAAAVAIGESVNGYISAAISQRMERDGAGSPQERIEQPAGAGGISLPPDALETAQEAAEAAGEALESFVARAVVTQAQQDRASLRMGINPATGGKLEQSGKGGADHE